MRRPGLRIILDVYCAVWALIYLALLALGVWLAWFGGVEAVASDPADPDEVGMLEAWILMILGGLLGAAHLIFPFLPQRRSTWIWGIVIIGIGLTSCLTWPVIVPLLIFWIKPATRRRFEEHGDAELERAFE